MTGNSFGHIFKLTTFGESHGVAIGGILDGVPAGFQIDLNHVQEQLNRRKPGQSKITTARKENDEVEWLSGVFEGQTTGTPLAFVIQNQDARSKDYSHIKDVYRPSHADFTYDQKYGVRDYRGGGRSSARETAVRVVAGAIAQQFLAQKDIYVQAFVSQVGAIKLEQSADHLDLKSTDDNIVRCPDQKTARKMEEHILEVKKEGDTIGGVISCVIKGVGAGLGAPVFDKLHADLGKAMLSINAVKGFEYGSGFGAVTMRGSEHNDAFKQTDSGVGTSTNHSGGIQGGISNGQPINFNVAFKPVATLLQKGKTLNKKGEEVEMQGKGRHDPCVVPRAVPIVESMAALVLMDHYLRNKTSRWE